MFNIDFLNKIRDYEINNIIKYISPDATILEIGGGTGFQAKKLAEKGFKIISIDVPQSNLADQKKEFPIILYDGNILPFEKETFDIVFSSNVLEHVFNLSQLHNEIRRVLKNNGYCIHVLPSGSWRFWSNITHYMEFFQKVFTCLRKRNFIDIISLVNNYLFVPSHSEKHNPIIEIFTFSRLYWIKHFKKYNMIVDVVIPMGLFYTGYMLFSNIISITVRTTLAKFLGSSCIIYRTHFDI